MPSDVVGQGGQEGQPSQPGQRLHPLSIGFAFLGSLRGWILPLGVALVTANVAGLGWQLWTLPFLALQALGAIVHYLTFRYRFEPGELVIRSGLLARKVRHIPYSRIQSLDAVRNPLHRLCGVVEARIQTGAGDAEPEAALSVLSLSTYDEMRRRLDEERRSKRAPAAPLTEKDSAGAQGAPKASGRTLLALPPREILLSGLLEGRGWVFIALLFGLYWESQWMGFDLPFDGKGGDWKGNTAARQAVRDWFPSWKTLWEWAGERLWVAILGVVAFLLLLRVVSALLALIRLHGFRLTREADTLRTEHGLWTRVLASLPVHRIQALTVSAGLLQRRAGRVSVRAEVAGLSPQEDGEGEGGKGGKRTREKLAPILRREELPALVGEVLPGIDFGDLDWRPPAPRAFRRELKGALIFILPLTIPGFVFLRFWGFAVLAALVGWAVFAADRTVKHLGWALTGDGIAFRSGWLRRQVTIVPFAKVQAVDLHDSPFDRRAGMAGIRVDTAGAGSGSHRVEIPYLLRDDAAALYRQLSQAAGHSAFRW